MGCDIHGWVEKKVNGKYIAIRPFNELATQRNYERFGRLALVRDHPANGLPALGIPDDVSDTVRYHIDKWGDDGHSHSYMPLAQAAQLFLETAYQPSTFERNHPIEAYFDYAEEDEESEPFNARIVFWFDN